MDQHFKLATEAVDRVSTFTMERVGGDFLLDRNKNYADLLEGMAAFQPQRGLKATKPSRKVASRRGGSLLPARIRHLEGLRKNQREVASESAARYAKQCEQRVEALREELDAQREKEKESHQFLLKSLEERYEVSVEDIVQRMKVLEEKRLTNALEALNDPESGSGGGGGLGGGSYRVLSVLRGGEKGVVRVQELLEEHIEKERSVMRERSQEEIDLKLQCVEDGCELIITHVNSLIGKVREETSRTNEEYARLYADSCRQNIECLQSISSLLSSDYPKKIKLFLSRIGRLEQRLSRSICSSTVRDLEEEEALRREKEEVREEEFEKKKRLMANLSSKLARMEAQLEEERYRTLELLHAELARVEQVEVEGLALLSRLHSYSDTAPPSTQTGIDYLSWLLSSLAACSSFHPRYDAMTPILASLSQAGAHIATPSVCRALEQKISSLRTLVSRNQQL